MELTILERSARLRQRLDDSRHALSPNTFRALEWGLTTWGRLCDTAGVCPLPACPEDIAAALKGPLTAHLAPGSLALLRWSIGWAHRASELPDPTTALVVSLALKGRRRLHRGQRQVAPFTRDVLYRVEAAMEGSTTFEDIRDQALLRFLYDTGMRRSEAVALNGQDLRAEPDQSGRVSLRRSKTDQEGHGAVLYVAPDTMVSIARYHARRVPSPSPSAPLWVSAHARRLTGTDIARILKRRIAQAGLNAADYAGHSPRVGLAHDMVAANIELPAIMAQGRWRSPAMVERYARQLAAGRSASARLATLQGRALVNERNGVIEREETVFIEREEEGDGTRGQESAGTPVHLRPA